MPVRILSDFDGVWTDQVLEAESVKLFLTAELARVGGANVNRAWADVQRFERSVREAPDRYGWAPDGRVTAFVDEDPFCVANAVVAYLAQRGDERASTYAQGIHDAGFESLAAFSDHCFVEATSAYRTQHPPALVPDAAEIFGRLHDLGVEVVVVSNSHADKIIGWFRTVGVDAGTGPGHAIRVRGAAGKQTLGETDETFDVGGRGVFVDRPLYRKILEEERPDVVIGDVFSLDLSLPHCLRRDGLPFAPSMLVLRRHPHTPPWTLDLHAGGIIDRVVDSVAELEPIALELARSAGVSS